ncbi:GCN5-like N-acetyltransferase [Dactylonectria macrodidyma]|uniref:GCN5-like N-acetyltransferase n=1 Tax=Dactylonectria macrodidyma TaxID=307937 RepID=A0A9P9DY06_9HYPO|nr:GCN5-like N-acetyltransferase [Dactylonectria macrodidyma]
MDIQIRDETARDVTVIRNVTEAAFKDRSYSQGTEGAIINILRSEGALTVSLVAILNGELVGHIAFSPVTIDGSNMGWYGLGPVSARRDVQGRGIGTALIQDGLSRIKSLGAKGCVVLGAKSYYQRFGFVNNSEMWLQGVSPDHFMVSSFCGHFESGEVSFHKAFLTTPSAASGK